CRRNPMMSSCAAQPLRLSGRWRFRIGTTGPRRRTRPPSMSDSVAQAKEAFGARLRDIRRDANLSGRELALHTGLHFTKVSRLEHGKQNGSEGDIRAWCRVCGAEDQIPELVAILRGIEGMYREWRRHTRAGLRLLQESVVPLYHTAAYGDVT